MRAILVSAFGLAACLCGCSKSPSVPGAAQVSAAPLPSAAHMETISASMENLAMELKAGEGEPLKGWMTFTVDRVGAFKPETAERGQVTFKRLSKLQRLAILNQPRKNHTEDSPLVGLSGAVESKGGHLVFQLAKPSEDPAVAKDLAEWSEMANAIDVFFANREPKVGDSWEVPASAASRWFGSRWREPKGTIRIQAKEIAERVLHAQIDLNLTGQWSADDKPMACELRASGSIKRSMDHRLDIDVTIGGEVKMSAGNAGGPAISLIGPVKISESRRLTFQ